MSRNPLQDNEYTMADLGLSNGLPIVELFPMLIAQERVAIAERNMNKLAALWIADGSIIDQRGTKKTEDDYIWSGRQAILDRYKLSVFRYSPPLIEPPADLAYGCLSGGYQDSNNSACLVLEPNEGDKINAHRNNGDAWQFVYMENRWWFEQLTYNP